MTSRIFGEAPTVDDIETVARETLKRLPQPFAKYLEDIVVVVEDFPSADILAEFGIEDPFELTGLYTGRPAELEVMTGDLPPMIHLFRRPILDEWVASVAYDEAGQAIKSGVALEDLVAHVLIHETGHHFGLSDDDMEWMEAQLKSGKA